MRVVVVGLGLMFGVGFGASPAWAHESIEQALARGAGPPAWVYTAGAWAAAVAMVAVAGRALARRLRSGRAALPRWWTAVGLLLAAWVLVGFVQSATARTPMGTPTVLYLPGTAVFLLAVTAVWAYVGSNTGSVLRRVLADRRYRWFAVGIAVIFAGVYLWAGNVIAPPDPDDAPLPGTPAFVTVVPLYGPLTVWPAVEFWLPQLNLFGGPSVGTVVVTVTIAGLLGLAWAAAVFAARGPAQQENTTVGAVGGLGAVGVTATFCPCCTPAVYPVLALVLGSTTASSVSAWLLGSTSPFYNLSMVAMIALMLWALTAACRRIQPAVPTAPAEQLPGSGAYPTADEVEPVRAGSGTGSTPRRTCEPARLEKGPHRA